LYRPGLGYYITNIVFSLIRPELLSTVGQAVVMSRDKLSIRLAGCPFGPSGLWWLCGFFAEQVSGSF